jgi:hypothetical protein
MMTPERRLFLDLPSCRCGRRAPLRVLPTLVELVEHLEHLEPARVLWTFQCKCGNVREVVAGALHRAA